MFDNQKLPNPYTCMWFAFFCIQASRYKKQRQEFLDKYFSPKTL